MLLSLTANRFVAKVEANGMETLWDGCYELGAAQSLPATDEEVRHTINCLLAAHEQRELPPEKPKKAKTKAAKAKLEDKVE